MAPSESFGGPEPFAAGELDPDGQIGLTSSIRHGRALRVERRHPLHERRRVAAQYPHVRVGRDLVEQRGDRAGDAGDVHLHDVVHGLAPEPRGREGLLAGGDELQLHEPRLRGDREHRHRRLRRLRGDVLEQSEDHSVREVVGQLEVILDHLLLAVLGVADRDLAAGADGGLHRHLERRTLLHHVVAHEPEALSLGVDGGLVVRGAVLEAEAEARRHAISVRGLDQVAVGELRPVERVEREEAVRQPFRVHHLDRVSRRRRGREQRQERHSGDDRGASGRSPGRGAHGTPGVHPRKWVRPGDAARGAHEKCGDFGASSSVGASGSTS